MGPGVAWDRLGLMRLMTGCLTLAHLAAGEDFCHDLGDSCMFIPSVDATWESAKQLCERIHPKARLLNIETTTKQQNISRVLQSLNFTDREFWVGGKLEGAHWHWVTDKTPLVCYMGYCSFNTDNRLSRRRSIYGNSAAACSQECRAGGFAQAYLKERSCVCGNDLCETIESEPNWLESCPGNLYDSCGNQSSHLYSVYATTDFNWKGDPPVVIAHSVEPHKACATAVISERTMQLTDRFCEEKQKALCQYHSPMLCDRNLSRDLCLRVNSTRSTWFDARAACRESGGDLAVLKGQDSLNVSSLQLYGHLWVGLWRLKEAWTSGEDIIFRPSPLIFGCLLIKSSDMTWEGADCSLYREFICEKRRTADGESTLEGGKCSEPNCLSDTSTKGLLHDCTSEDSATEITSKEDPLEIDASLTSKKNFNFNTSEDYSLEKGASKPVPGIVAAVVCFLIVIITVLVTCMYRRHRRKQRNGWTGEEMVHRSGATRIYVSDDDQGALKAAVLRAFTRIVKTEVS